MNKAKAAKLRAHKKRIKEQEAESLAKTMNRLKTLKSNFARTPLTKDKSLAVDLKLKTGPTPYRRPSSLGSSLNEFVPVDIHKSSPKLSPEMQLREKKAKDEYEAKKARIAPIGNKMGYQYMNDLDFADFKKGLLRRR